MSTNILILCTHNSARSVLAEGMLNHLAKVRGLDVRAFSAGSAPSGRINPLALEALAAVGVATDAFRSKSWDEFSGADAPVMRIVITVCDSAANEVCPYWPGTPIQMHWGYPDPSNAQGGDEDAHQLISNPLSPASRAAASSWSSVAASIGTPEAFRSE